MVNKSGGTLMLNIYCDESCHLEHDNSNCMVLGAISCPKEKVHIISEDLRALKEKHGLSKKYELKWIKVSETKIEYFKDVIDYFCKNDYLSFRAVVADKTHLRHEEFHQTHDEWYYKMYYFLLRYLISPPETYNVYLDIKDTNGGSKVSKLQDILNHTLYKFYNETVKNIQIIRSDESELLQLSDFVLGAVAYKNRDLSSSNSKLELCRYLESTTRTSLISSSSLNNTKFNIFIWKPRTIK